MLQLTEAEKISGGFNFVEGPVWIPNDHPIAALSGTSRACLIFSDIPDSRIYWYRAGETGVLREETGQSNGNALHVDGSLLSCEHETRRVSRMDCNGSVTTLADRFDGRRLNSPNDIVVRSDGAVFFTDPPYGVASEDRELEFQGVYRLSAADRVVRLLRGDFERPNGLAFSRDENQLFVADTELGKIVKFDVAPSGDLSGELDFCHCDRPDGLRLDREGNVWVACLDGVEIFSPEGERLVRIELPERPANIVFGDDDLSSLYICARTSIYRVRSSIPGHATPVMESFL